MSGEEKETILFVDDEENILRSLRRLFHREGYHILLAKSGRKGLELLQEHPVDLVVSDVRMPEMNGVEFLNRVRKTHPEVACMGAERICGTEGRLAHFFRNQHPRDGGKALGRFRAKANYSRSAKQKRDAEGL